MQGVVAYRMYRERWIRKAPISQHLHKAYTTIFPVGCGLVLAHRRGRYPGAGPSTDSRACRYPGAGPPTDCCTCRYPGADPSSNSCTRGSDPGTNHTIPDYAADTGPCPASTDTGTFHTITD